MQMLERTRKWMSTQKSHPVLRTAFTSYINIDERETIKTLTNSIPTAQYTKYCNRQ